MFPIIIMTTLGWILLSVSVLRTISLEARSKSLFASALFSAGLVVVIVGPRILSPVVLLCLIGIIGIGLRPSVRFLRRFLDEREQMELPMVLDELILAMKAGKNLRTATSEVGRRTSGRLGKLFREIGARLERGADPPAWQGLSGEIVGEIIKAYRANTKVIDRLIAYRRRCRARANFRRKSGQVTSQTRAQAIISLAIYVPMIFIHESQAEEGMSFRLPLSLALFVAAQIWIHIGARRIRWTV